MRTNSHLSLVIFVQHAVPYVYFKLLVVAVDRSSEFYVVLSPRVLSCLLANGREASLASDGRSYYQEER